MDMNNAPDRRGTGSFKWDLARPEEIPLWVADMDFPVAPEVTRALTERIAHPVYGYTAVSDAYLEAFCAWQGNRNRWNVSPEQLVVVPGVMPAISLLVETRTRQGDAVALFSPVYFPFFEVVEQLGRRVERIPLAVERDGNASPGAPRQGIDREALEEALSRSRLLLLCSPHNPGGRVWTADELTLIADAADRHRVTVLSDEIHSDLVFPGETFLPWLTVRDRAAGDVALLAPSKTFNIPGLPTAIAVVPDEHHRRDLERILHARKQDMSNLLAITAAHAAYSGAGPWLEKVREVLRANYELVRRELKEEPGTAVYRMEGTFIAWIDFRDRWSRRDNEGSSVRFDAVARDHGVWLSRGRQFGPEGEGHMRLNFATTPELLQEGLARLRRALQAFDRDPGAGS